MLYIYLIGGDHAPAFPGEINNCRIIPFPIDDWDAALTPWPAPGISKGRCFTGEAEKTLASLLSWIREYEAENGIPEKRAIAGYSLAGLFSLWAITRCALFDRAASVSGSLWYDGWYAYLQASGFLKMPERVWLSVGEREKQTRNPRMKCVEDEARRTEAWIQKNGIECHFEIMPGGHFDHIEERMEKACRYLAEYRNAY